MNYDTYANCVARLLNNTPGMFFFTPDNRMDLLQELAAEYEDVEHWEAPLSEAYAIVLRRAGNKWVTYTHCSSRED